MTQERGGRNCPVTRGNPTAMTMASWDRLCAATKEEAQGEMDIAYRHIMFKKACLFCSGELPVEVTIIELPVTAEVEVGEMGKNKTKLGVCTCCKEKKTVRISSNGDMCAGCDLLRTYIRQRPHVIIEQLRALAPGLLASSGEGGEMVDVAELREQLRAAVADHNSARLQVADLREQLDKTAAASVYAVDTVEAANIRQVLQAGDDDDLVEVAGRLMNDLASMNQAYLNESQALSDALARCDELERQLHERNREATVCVFDSCRHNMHDLALRLAISVMKGDIGDLGVKDVEMLRCVA